MKPFSLNPVGLFVLMIVSPVFSQKYYPGSPCDDNTDCGVDPSSPTNSFMECDLINKWCKCDETVTYFDPVDAVCYRPVGQECNPGPTPPTTQPCSPNSVCEPSTAPGTMGICECKTPFEVITANNYKKCVLSQYGKCGEEKHCNRDAFMDCLSTLCDCKTDSYFDKARQQCVINNKEKCETASWRPQPCELGSKCNGARCECKSPFEINDDGNCRLQNGIACAENIECDESKYLICGTSGHCECPHGSTYEDRKCKILADQLCHSGATSQPCVDFSDCRFPGGQGQINYKCICQSGLIESPSYHCVLPYNQVCTGLPGDRKCNEEIHQKCHDTSKSCLCNDVTSNWYDPETKSCFILEGADCDPNASNLGRQPCAPNSYCMTSTSSPSGGTCKCSTDMVANTDRRCFLPLNKYCNTVNDLCDKKAFLHCDPVSRHCECDRPMDTTLDDTGKECRRRAGASCTVGAKEQRCVDNSDCTQIDGGPFKCHCSGDLLSNELGKCVRPYGHTCGPSLPGLCNAIGYQECKNGFCDCLRPIDMVPVVEENKCYLRLDSSCTQGGEPCVETTVCQGGRCVCDASQGWLENDGECVKMWGSICMENKDCNEEAYLECMNGTCVCGPSYSLTDGVNGTQVCLGNLGAGCRGDEECNMTSALTCQSGYCACAIMDEQTYDFDQKICFSNLNSKCYLEMPPEEKVPLVCDPKFTCQPANDISPPTGRCSCGLWNETGAFPTRECRNGGGRIHFERNGFYFVILLWILVEYF